MSEYLFIDNDAVELQRKIQTARTIWDLLDDGSFGARLLPRLPYRGPSTEAKQTEHVSEAERTRIDSLLGDVSLSASE